MLTHAQTPGRLVIRSRTAPTWLVLLLALLHVPLLAILLLAAARVPRVVELRCDRADGRCVVLADGAPIRERPLASVTGATWRADPSRKSVTLLLVTSDGGAWPAMPGLRRARAERDAAEVRAFLADEGAARLELEWDYRLLLAGATIGLPIVMVLALGLFALPTTFTVDRLARTVTVGRLRRCTRRLDAYEDARVQTGAEEAEARARRRAERTGRKPWLTGPGSNPRRHLARRVVLVAADGGLLPVTAWLAGGEDAAGVAERLRTFLR